MTTAQPRWREIKQRLLYNGLKTSAAAVDNDPLYFLDETDEELRQNEIFRGIVKVFH
jgi:hypothetical protein